MNREPLKLESKSQRNRDFWDTEGMFRELHKWVPKRKFQPGEYTTGQVAEILHLSIATIGTYCEKGLFPGAFKEEERGWWHIPESALEAITERVQKSDISWTRRYWPRQASFGGPYDGSN